MNKKSIFALLLSSFILFSAFTINNNDRLYEISKNIEIFIKVYKELNANYVDDIDPTYLMTIGLNAMVGSLDPYTNYISESQIESYRISTDGRYEGIGAVVKKIDEYVTIIEPYAGSPVLEAGLKAGDQIIGIEGRSTKGKSREEVTQIYRGVPGTKINMEIHRPFENISFDIELTRSQVNIPNVPYSGFVDSEVGYISLTTFTAGASKNIRQALRDLKNENPSLKGVILDLRNNGGGLLAEAIKVSNIFIGKGKEVVSVKSKVRERDLSYKTQDLPTDEKLPLIVMINKSSASASEIVSGTIQDYDRGVLMGQKSYGKGLVQNTKDVGYNSQVKLTTSKYYIPSGRCIQSVEYNDGEPVDIPDEKRAKFKTSIGRIVLDGGGVSPDYEIPRAKRPDIVKELLAQSIIFKYVDQYMSRVDTSTRELEEVIFTDYQDFVGYVNATDFEYESENQKMVSSLKKNFEEESAQDLIEEINALEMKLAEVSDQALDKHAELISNLIEEQIATRLNFQKGKVFQNLKNDSEIKEAISLFNNQAEYNKLIGI